MKVLHIVPGLSPQSGGPTRSISGLCRALAHSGVNTILFIHTPEHALSNPSGVRCLSGTGLRLPELWQNTIKVIDQVKPDIIHLNGLWMPANHLAICVAHKQKIPVLLSTHGNLHPWALRQKSFKKKIALWLYQRRDLRRVTCFHATAEPESKIIRSQGFPQPIWVIPNGIDVPEVLPLKVPSNDGRKTALFLSRLHPGKGLLDLVQAWARVRPKDWRMRIVGPDVCGHKAEVQAAINRLELQKDFEFIGELDDEAKWQEYVNADLFVHPSHSENFGISIAEALAAGLPVITTKEAPWSDLLGRSDSFEIPACESAKTNERKDGTSDVQTLEPSNDKMAPGCCGWWTEIGPEPLANALQAAIKKSDSELNAMGANGQQLIQSKYTWPRIAAQMKMAYASVLKSWSEETRNN